MPVSKTRRTLSYLAFSFRIILGIVFIFSGSSKILDLDSFRWALVELKFFGWTFILFLSIVIIIAEIGVGVLLLSGLFTTFASIHLAILIIAFAWVSIFAVMHGDIRDCNCLGKVINLSYGPAHFVLLAVLLMMDLFVLFEKERLYSLDRVIKNKGYKCFLRGFR